MKKLYTLAALVALLALVLLLTSWRTLRALDGQRAVYLRSVAASIAGRLESDPAALPEDGRVLVIAPGDAADTPDLSTIWQGGELFRTAALDAGEPVFRAFVPFHSPAGLRIARIDVPSREADFLLVHARHNVLAAAAASVALLLLLVYGIWSARRAARLEQRQLALAHLAQIGEMASVLAHEIRNPLGTIKGYAQLLAEHAEPESRRMLDPIVSETQRLERLVTDLLSYGRPPRPELRPVPCRELLAALAVERPEVAIAEGPELTVHTDPDLAREILTNLVRNSAEASASRILVLCRTAGSQAVEIEVADDGPGISDHLRERVFQPFFTTKPFGTGLGLAIAERLAHSLNGELRLAPAVPHGTRAILRLPRTRLRASSAAEGRLDGVHSGSG